MKKRDILIVDDDKDCLNLIGCIIEYLGFEANYATSGEEALGILKNKSFGIMITDLKMSGMDGLELALLAKKYSPQMEIVIASGLVSADVFQLAAEIGISRFLGKPYDISQLREVLLGNNTELSCNFVFDVMKPE